jgi:molecular chaperone DnaK
VPQIEVTFDVDKDGILKVSAVDKATGRSQHITIHSSSGLTEDEVERLRKEAEAHATEDRKRREFVDARNRADTAIYAAEKALREMGAQMPADGRSRVEARLQTLRQLRDGNEGEPIRRGTTDLLSALHEVGAKPSDTGGIGGSARGGGTGGQPRSGGGPATGGSAPKTGGGGTGSPQGKGGAGGSGPSRGDDAVEGEFREA